MATNQNAMLPGSDPLSPCERPPGRQRTPRKPIQIPLIAILLVALAASGYPTYSLSDNADFLLFVSGEYIDRQGLSNDDFDETDFTPASDLLYTYAIGSWRALGEYYLTDDESELERLQLGYDLTADTTVWVGRFHQPISAWNFKYHHGAYLQPSITRPSIENWEDDNGVLPAHATGVMIESGVRRSGGDGVRFTASVGRGPTLADSQLRPFDLADRNNLDGDLAASFAISYFPDYVGSSNLGLVGGYTDIVVLQSTTADSAETFNIEQYLLGIQADWQRDDWQLIAATYYVDNKPDTGHDQFGGSFVAGYLQMLNALTLSTDGYLRLEGGRDTKSAGYLSQFPDFIAQRALIGVGFDIAVRQKIAFELSNVETMDDDFSEFRIQWSSVFQ